MSIADVPFEIPADVDRTIRTPSTMEDACLPDETRILHLLQANGQPLWQTEIVDALDVSKSTVSRRLTDLEREGHVERLQYRGRNLVWLPE